MTYFEKFVAGAMLGLSFSFAIIHEVELIQAKARLAAIEKRMEAKP